MAAWLERAERLERIAAELARAVEAAEREREMLERLKALLEEAAAGLFEVLDCREIDAGGVRVYRLDGSGAAAELRTRDLEEINGVRLYLLHIRSLAELVGKARALGLDGRAVRAAERAVEEFAEKHCKG